jgi:hypothetical protein
VKVVYIRGAAAMATAKKTVVQQVPSMATISATVEGVEMTVRDISRTHCKSRAQNMERPHSALRDFYIIIPHHDFSGFSSIQFVLVVIFLCHHDYAYEWTPVGASVLTEEQGS